MVTAKYRIYIKPLKLENHAIGGYRRGIVMGSKFWGLDVHIQYGV